ncbi:type VI secretion system contractile sheath small subunit [Shewanella surugensis]|uniref:Type VI secretion system contractile sheath small subunit n=1 Tax=Shewanella surugensis TaxID=212020 RepID=A0ABT0L7I7_9GAMM|nr:type VI secretion system contractile sheath small subunit [Shewanella surugensis]MCL1123465.1 type VI secretion system contractile sheath small subunit [Shewanella surugensis]
MSSKGSIAPKERVNIVYKPDTGDAAEEVELPLKVLVMGDFTLAQDDRSIEDRHPVNIDKDNFNDVLQAQNIVVDLVVPGKLAGQDSDEMAVKLALNTMKDFEPDQIIQQVPELAKLLELREALKALKSPLSNIPDFRKKIQSLVQDDSARDALMKELGIDEAE